MHQDEDTSTELWRWKMTREVADFINQPDDSNMTELKTMIESYRDYHKIKSYITSNFN